jgi:predicted transcriptional regulator
VHAALQNVSNPVRQETPTFEPAVPVKKSVHPELLIS